MTDRDPIFQSVFAGDWQKLPAVMYKRYANKPYSSDAVTATGEMEVVFGWYIKMLLPFLRLFGALVPYQGKSISVVVNLRSDPNNAALCMDRVFYFKDKKPFKFRSSMVEIEGDDVVEFLRFGVGWRIRYYFDGSKVVLAHRGYVWKLFGKLMPMPLHLILGKIYAQEIALSEDSFSMLMTITHPLFGKIYEYKGTLNISGMSV